MTIPDTTEMLMFFKVCQSVGNLCLVVRSKYCLETNRWTDADHESYIISHILDLANWLHICITCFYSLTVRFIADAIFLMPQWSASHTHSLSVSPWSCSLSPSFCLILKKPGKPLHIIIVLNKLFRITTSMFHLEVCSQ